MAECIVAVRAHDREALKALIRDVRSWGYHSVPIMEITMSCCGERRQYRDEHDIPVNDVQCPCGNWFIKYDEQPLQVVW